MGFGMTNPVHIALIALALPLVFGAKRLPDMGRSLGAGLREFKDSIGGPNEPHALAAQSADDRDRDAR